MSLLFNTLSISPTTGGGGGSSVNVSALNITPTTSAQSFVANVGEAYSPVNVSAVNASIDPNITAQNIVNGCQILGVIGSASATAPKEVARYVVDENGVATVSDKDLTGMFDDITDIKAASLEGAFKSTSVSGEASFNNCRHIGELGALQAFYNTNITGISFLNSATTGYNALKEIAAYCNNINEANLCGIYSSSQSSFEGAFRNSKINYLNLSGLPSVGLNGCRNLCSGGTVNHLDVSNISNVSNWGFAYAFSYGNGLETIYLPELQITNEAAFLYFCYYGNGITTFNAPKLRGIGGNAFNSAFAFATNLTYFNISENVNILASNVYTGSNAFKDAFKQSGLVSFSAPINGIQDNQFSNAFFNCKKLTTVNLSFPSITTNTSAGNVYTNMCCNCPNLVSVDLSSLRNVGYSTMDSSLDNAFRNCYNLTSVNLYSLEPMQAGTAFRNAYWNCTNLKTMEYPALYCLGTGNCFENAYRNSGIQNLYFSGLYEYTNNANVRRPFVNMLTNVSNCTVHFPAVARTYLENHQDFLAGFGGTNTTILFDLPNVVNNFSNFYNMSSSGEMGGVTLAVNASSENADAWQAMNSTAGTGWHSAVSEVEHYYTIYCPEGMRLTYANLITDSTVNQMTNQPVMTNVCVSNDGTNWNQVLTTMMTFYSQYKNITFSKPGYHKYYRFYFNSYQNNPSYLVTINRIYLYGSHKYI